MKMLTLSLVFLIYGLNEVSLCTTFICKFLNLLRAQFLRFIYRYLLLHRLVCYKHLIFWQGIYSEFVIYRTWNSTFKAVKNGFFALLFSFSFLHRFFFLQNAFYAYLAECMSTTNQYAWDVSYWVVRFLTITTEHVQINCVVSGLIRSTRFELLVTIIAI